MIEKIKKYLKKDLKPNKIKFEGTKENKLYATITREDGSREKVYWNLEKDYRTGKIGLSSVWYYSQ